MMRVTNSLRFQLYTTLALLVLMILAAVLLNGESLNVLQRSENRLVAAGLQRSNAYLLASLARRELAAANATDKESIINLINSVITNIEQIQRGLRDGDPAYNLEAISQVELLLLLDDLDTSWANYINLMNQFTEADDDGKRDLLAQIDNQSTTVFTFADRFVNGLTLTVDLQQNGIRQSLFAISFAALIVIVVAVIAVTRVVRSIQALSKTTRAYASGYLETRANVATLNEVSVLGESFNEMANRLSQLIRQLENQVEESEDARKEAERSNHVKSAFLASMSHELRTPLNAVINFTKFVAQGDLGPVNEEQKETLLEAVDSARHLLNLINDVLDMSKIESGSLNLFVQDNINLKEILDQVTTTAQALLEGRPVEVRTEIHPDLPFIRADRQRVRQVMLNLISNACKFTESGYIELRATCEDGNVLIAVEDTGLGIPPEDHLAIFEAFKQTSNGLRQGGGTGLGLPISKNLIEIHGGKLWLESETNKGSTFFVRLPVKSEDLVPLVTR